MHKSREVTNLREIFHLYQSFFIDQWGVLHDGEQLFSEALATLHKLKEYDKIIILVSNTSKSRLAAERRLNALGLTPELYDFVTTSGETFRQAVLTGEITSLLHNKQLYYILNADDDKSVMDGLGYQEVENIKDCQFIVCAGLSGEIDSYNYVLEEALRRNLVMLCINPDRVSLRGHKQLKYGAGELAWRYAQKGGLVSYYGKPERNIFLLALRHLNLDLSMRPLVIGDSLHNDIKGAHNMLWDSLLITQGIHINEMNLEKQYTDTIMLCKPYNVVVNYNGPSLKW